MLAIIPLNLLDIFHISLLEPFMKTKDEINIAPEPQESMKIISKSKYVNELNFF